MYVCVAYFSEVQNGCGCPISPLVTALGTGVAHLPESVHNRLQDGGKRGDSDSGADEHRVLCPEYLARRRPEWAVDVHLFVRKCGMRR